MSKVTDEQTQLSDRDWWQEAGNHLNLELHGWTFRNNASFIDRETRQYVPLTGAIAARLIALEAASSTPDGEVVRRKTFDEGAAMIFIKPLEWERHDSAMPRGPYASRIVAHAKAALAFHYTVHEHAQGPQKFEVFRGLGGERGASLEFYSTIDAAKAAARADFDARILSCLSHNAGEIEAGGEVAEPTRYDMVKMTGSLTLLPAVRADGEWVRYADHEASIASAIAGFDRLAATQNGIVHQITARAEAAEKRIAELEAVIRGLLRSEYESAEPGLTDCIDNTGTPYQSQYLADQIKLAEATLKESRL